VAGSDDIDDYAILDLSHTLVRKSLLVAHRSSGRPRFSMLETVRQFAEEQLVASGAATEVHTAHSRYFAGREADIWALWDSPRQREAYAWFTVEFANLRTAFRWVADHGDLDVAATIATYAGSLGAGTQTHEPVAWAEELIEPASAVEHPRLAFLHVIASLCFTTGRDRGGCPLLRSRSDRCRQEPRWAAPHVDRAALKRPAQNPQFILSLKTAWPEAAFPQRHRHRLFVARRYPQLHKQKVRNGHCQDPCVAGLASVGQPPGARACIW
jgi:hypothetical protein